jgi:hypothetical protein
MKTLTPQTLDEIRSKTVLSDLIGETVSLTQAGKEWRGLCPFHDEKTSSFTVHDEKGFYHCFGCGAHGDAIRWLTDVRKIPFKEAVITLATTAGMQIKFEEETKKRADGDSAVATRKGGAKLSRSETVTVRLDPKLNYLCELAARAQRRTKSSFIEWAVAEVISTVALPEVVSYEFSSGDKKIVTIQAKSSDLWHVDEADRVIALALIAPALLSHDEQLIWRLVKENGYLWKGSYNLQGDWTWELDDFSLIRERLRVHWDIFKAVAAGEAESSLLPKWQKTNVVADDEIPF